MGLTDGLSYFTSWPVYVKQIVTEPTLKYHVQVFKCEVPALLWV